MKVLVVVDAQNDFITGALRNEKAIEAMSTLKKVVKYAREHNFSIIYTRDTHYEDYLETFEGKNLPVPHCIHGTEGWQIAAEIQPRECDIIVDKYTFGYNEWYDLFEDCSNDDAERIDEFLICGFCTDICVIANYMCLKAECYDTPITVIANACAGVTPEKHEAALEVMRSCQANIIEWSD